jgi:hypothetical protein
MITKLVHLLEKLTAGILGSLAVGTQLGNILVCVCLIVLGPTFTVDFLAQ